MKIYPIPPGLFCVPSAITALTGADPVSVITPALNRHSLDRGQSLLDTVSGASMGAARAVLEELGYRVRPYRDNAAAGPLRAHLATWARRSAERWPGRALLVSTRGHCLVVSDGRVYDTFQPRGVLGADHPFARTTVAWAALVETGSLLKNSS